MRASRTLLACSDMNSARTRIHGVLDIGLLCPFGKPKASIKGRRGPRPIPQPEGRLLIQLAAAQVRALGQRRICFVRLLEDGSRRARPR